LLSDWLATPAIVDAHPSEGLLDKSPAWHFYTKPIAQNIRAKFSDFPKLVGLVGLERKWGYAGLIPYLWPVALPQLAPVVQPI
jgi:hypothetical protein